MKSREEMGRPKAEGWRRVATASQLPDTKTLMVVDRDATGCSLLDKQLKGDGEVGGRGVEKGCHWENGYRGEHLGRQKEEEEPRKGG